MSIKAGIAAFLLLLFEAQIFIDLSSILKSDLLPTNTNADLNARGLKVAKEILDE